MEEIGKILVNVNGSIQEMSAYNREEVFDPMTGSHKKITVVATGFDPMSGEPTYSSIAPDSFDPMSGRQVYRINNSSQGQNKAMGSSKKTNKGISKKALIIAGAAVGAVVVIAGIILALVLSGAFLSPQEKILLAVYNTIDDDTIGHVALQSADILSSGDINSSFSVDVVDSREELSVSGEFSADLDNAEIYLSGQGEYDNISQSVQFYSNDEKVQLALPDISDDVYEYDFTKDNDDGFIADVVDDYTKGDISDVNNIFVCAADYMKKSSKLRSVQKKKLLKALDEMEIESIDSEDYEVNGSDRSCKGYELVVTEDTMEAIFDAIDESNKEVYDDIVESLVDSINNLTGENVDTDDIYRSMSRELGDLDDIKIQVFIYKNMLAAIKFKVDGGTVLIEFQGGDTRTSNITMSYKNGNYKASVKKESSIEGGVEKGKIKGDGIDTIKYEYDKSNGDFSLKTNDFSFSNASFLVKGNTISFNLKYDGNNSYDPDVKVELTISKGAKIGSIKGDVVDIASLDRTDLFDIFEELDF